jgi:RNA polymerase-binding protein DksA
MEKDIQSQAESTPKASSRDVLGSTPDEGSIPTRWHKPYRILTGLRNAILNRQRDRLNQAAEEVTLPQRNMGDVGTDEFDRDLALSMASSEQELIYEIDQAIDRINKGTYGVCEATGKPIPPQRLAAIPWARFSAEAESQLEREGQVQRAHLGQLEEVPKVTAGE